MMVGYLDPQGDFRWRPKLTPRSLVWPLKITKSSRFGFDIHNLCLPWALKSINSSFIGLFGASTPNLKHCEGQASKH